MWEGVLTRYGFDVDEAGHVTDESETQRPVVAEGTRLFEADCLDPLGRLTVEYENGLFRVAEYMRLDVR